MLSLDRFDPPLLLLLLSGNRGQLLQAFFELVGDPTFHSVHPVAELGFEGGVAPPDLASHHLSDGF